MTARTTRSWQAIRDEVLRRIHAREWAAGARIPAEADLAVEFGCARATVNRALRDLAESGFLERRRRAGTRVAAHPVRKARFDIPVIRREVEDRGGAYAHVLLERARAAPPPGVRGQMRLPPGGPQLLHLRSLHLSDGRPHAYEDRWVNTAAAPGILKADLARQSANEWLVAHLPVTGGDYVIAAENAGAEVAELLDCAAGAAILVVERLTLNGGEPVTFVRLHHAPGHRVQTAI